jgi:hypothetical protein
MYAFQAKKEETFHDIKLSNLTLEGKMGQENISFDTHHSTVIVWFHPECDHCRYQLDVINNNIRRLRTARFLFITAEKDFSEKSLTLLGLIW